MDGSNYYVFLNALFSTYPSHLRKTLIYLNTILLKVIQWEDSKKSFKEVVSSFPFRIYVVVQLGQLSVIPPRLVLEVGGDFSLAGSCAWRAEVPPYLEP